MTNLNYPPDELVKVSGMEKKNYEHIILWMLHNNEESEWSNFIQEPLEIPSSTLSRYLNSLKSDGYIESFEKGHYKITSEGKKRFNTLSRKKEEKRKINYPPEAIVKTGRNYPHWILWMLYNNNACKWADFLEEPLSINQSSLSKTINSMIEKGLIDKNVETKEYRITLVGKDEYSRILHYYNLDKQTILREESKRIEEIAKLTKDFFKKYKIINEKVQYRFLNNILKLDYERVKSVLKSEEDFHKILLFLSINHPSQFPDYFSPGEFSKSYEIKENMLTYYIDEIIENKIYPIKFFELKAQDNKIYYFQENGKFELIIRAITEDYITESTYLTKLFTKSLNFSPLIEKISNEVCEILLDEGLKKPFDDFLPSYIDHLAFKIEAKREFKESYDKIEGIIWQNVSDMIKSKSPEQKLKELNNKIESDSDNIDLYFLKSKVLINLGKANETLKLLDDLVGIFPKNKRDILIKKAFTLKKINEIEAGLDILNELLQKDPTNEELLVYKAYWLQYLNNKEESLELIQNLIELNPENGMNYDTFGDILMHSEEYQNASVQFQKAIEIDAEKWYAHQTYIKLGICYKELGEYESAITNLKKGKELTDLGLIEIDYETKQKWLNIANIFIEEMEDVDI